MPEKNHDLLRLLAIALDGFTSLEFINEHMRTSACQDCNRATTRRIMNIISDEEYLEQVCVPTREAMAKIFATKNLAKSMAKALDEAEKKYS